MAEERVDHYEVLCISSAASSDEIKKAYRSLSRLYHPDKAGLHADEQSKREHERRMIALNAAYQILMSPSQRRTYDLSRDVPTVQPQQQKTSSTYAAAATAAARRAASWGHSRSFTPRQANVHPMPGSSGRNTPDETLGTKPNGSASSSQGNVPKPRYYTAGKYTHSARQARRMDPAQYTTHIDGRAHEFEVPTGVTGACGKVPVTSVGSENDSFAVGAPPAPRNPTWLQKQIDLAAEWEDKFCPAEPVEKYQWRKASDNWLRNIRERKSAREQLEEESEKLHRFDVPGPMSGCVA